MTVDQKTIKACTKNDRRAQALLYKSCYGYLMGVCRRYYRNTEDAESVLNQSFLKVLTHIKKYREEVPFQLWIRRITINTIFDEFRKNKKHKETMVEQPEDGIENQTKLVSFNEGELRLDAEGLFKLLDELPDVSRKVFSLHAVDGYQHKDIAELMNISIGTSKWHVNNARMKLIQMIEDKKILLEAV